MLLVRFGGRGEYNFRVDCCGGFRSSTIF